jgi:hypothetical protein
MELHSSQIEVLAYRISTNQQLYSEHFLSNYCVHSNFFSRYSTQGIIDKETKYRHMLMSVQVETKLLMNDSIRREQEAWREVLRR